MAGSEDSDAAGKKAAAPEEGSLVPSADIVPPPPAGNIHVPGGASVSIAFMQNPGALASLPADIQRSVFEEISEDNKRQFELSKMALETQERGRNASLLERQETRKQAVDERRHTRFLLILSLGLVGAVATGVYIFLLLTNRDEAAAAFFQDCLKVAGGALGGGGATAIYKGARRP